MALESQFTPNSTNEILPPTPSQGSRPSHHRSWGKDRRWIGWKQSARAIVFSSCQSSLDVWHGYMREYSTHLSQSRTQCFGRLHSSCQGIPLLRMVTWDHLCTYAITICCQSVCSQILLPVCISSIR